MSTTIKDLMMAGQIMIGMDIAHAEQAAAQKQAKREAIKRDCVEAVRAELQLSDEVWSAFTPEYRENMQPCVTLSFLGRSIGFTVERRRYGYQLSKNGTPPMEYLARSMAKIAAEIERDVEHMLNNLRVQTYMTWQLNYHYANVGLTWNEPRVRAARRAFLLAAYDGGQVDDASSARAWMKEADLLVSEPTMAERLKPVTADLFLKVNKLDLLECIIKRRDPQTGNVLGDDNGWNEDLGRYSDAVTPEEVEAYRVGARQAGLVEDAEVQAAIARRDQQMRDALLQIEIEEQRDNLEAELFRPFHFYEVRYSMIGESDSGEEREVDWDWFAVLHADEIDENGFYHTLSGMVIRPRNVIAEIRRDCTTIEMYRGLAWSKKFMRETEFGEIRVFPNGAKLIDAGVK